ncbi:response regulator [Clostridium sp. AL.422]|uniref:response regulator n=1 Tax=Clostridium TaxID=1485 RepID=UPI00293DC691|nr:MULTISPECIES: response regulator [unclassified Clostridium]MDV4149799.1 response regulator [Clostridium sp. AL.422]
MYKLLIVDDEPLVQVGVKSMIDWSSFNIEVIGMASNGKQAIDIIEEDFPDIIITDVKMPIMGGIELIKYCKENYKVIPIFIILTSYEDFKIAKKAIQYNVDDYLVKLELTPQLLQLSIENSLKKIEKRAQDNEKVIVKNEQQVISSLKDRFFIRLLYNLFEDDSNIYEEASQLGLNLENKTFITCFCDINSNSKEDIENYKLLNIYMCTFNMVKQISIKYLKCFNIFLDVNHFAVICYFDKDESINIKNSVKRAFENISDAIKNYFNVNIRIGIGDTYDKLQFISNSFREARDAYNLIKKDKYIEIYSKIEEVENENRFNISSFNEGLRRSLEEYDSKKLHDIFDNIIKLLKNSRNEYLKSIDCACNILYISLNLLPDGVNCINDMFSNEVEGYRSIYKTRNVDEVIQWLSLLRDRLCEYIDYRKQNYKHHIVTQVKKYINDNLEERIYLNETANIHNISPSYLSLVFKKDCNMGFSEYVNLMKINKAKELLAKGNYKVYEISDKLGFESAFYFSKVFKKITGYSPKDYIKIMS